MSRAKRNRLRSEAAAASRFHRCGRFPESADWLAADGGSRGEAKELAVARLIADLLSGAVGPRKGGIR